MWRAKAFLLAALLASPLWSHPAQRQPVGLRVVLLGTGYPRPEAGRAGPSTAVAAGNKLFVVDAGRGVMMRLAASGLLPDELAAVFLTHLHSDHISGLPDVFNTTWVIYKRQSPLQLYGPPGTRKIADGILRFYAEDISIRRSVEMLPPSGAAINSHIVKEGVVYQDSGVRVIAFAVEHPPVRYAFGYRFETANRTVVISGDTRPSENLVRHARNADVLVHEAYLPEHFDRVDKPEVARRLKYYHSTPEEAGEVAQKAGVKLLVLSHLVPGDQKELMLARARKTFKGNVVVGNDLDTF